MWVCSYGIVNCSCCRYDEPVSYWKDPETGKIDFTRTRMNPIAAENLKAAIYRRLGEPTFNTSAYLKANPPVVKDVSFDCLLSRDMRVSDERARLSGDLHFLYNVHSLEHERLNNSQR